jgi:KDO2-lipid IV(A) lauroyltransferase
MNMHKNNRVETGDCLQLFLLRCFVAFLRYWPLKCVCGFGRCLGGVLHYLLASRRKVVRRNLEITKTALQSTGRQDILGSHQSLASNAAEALAAPVEQLSLEVFKRSFMHFLVGFRLNQVCFQITKSHVKVRGLECMIQALQAKRGAILLLGHMGPWEVLSQLPLYFKESGITAPFAAMYRPLNNAAVDLYVRKLREQFGMQLFSREDGFHKPMGFLRAGGILGVLADQKMREGTPASFFGIEVPTNPLPGLMHRRTGAPMLVLSFKLVGPQQWELSFKPVKLPEGSAVKERSQMARAANMALEAAFLQSPLDVFWLHKRF